MYAPIEDCVAHALSGKQTKPLIQCEYSHAMGNSNGTLADTWAAIESTPGLQGGFIWEFWDHGILQRVNDGRPAGRGGAGLYEHGVAAPGHRWAYGGDFGETIHDGAFIADGVVFPDRTPKPVMYEHREIAAPVRLTYDQGVLLVHNRQHFRGLEWLAAEWCLVLADGTTVTAPAELPDVLPGESAAVPLPFPVPEGESWLTLRVDTADDEAVGAARHRGVSAAGPAGRGRRRRDAGARVRPGRHAGRGRAAGPSAADRRARALAVAGAHRQRRAGRHGGPLARLGARRRSYARSWTCVTEGTRVVVAAEYATGAGPVRHEQVFTPVAGGLRVEESAELPEGLDDVARVGTVFETVAGLDVLDWYGQGPWESYPDRSTGAPVGHHSLPVDELFTPYLRPQESGGRHGVRRFTLSAPDATGLDRGARGAGAGLRQPVPGRGSGRRRAPRRAGAAARLCRAPRRRAPGARHGVVRARHLGHLVAPGTQRWAWTLRAPPPVAAKRIEGRPFATEHADVSQAGCWFWTWCP